MSFFVIIPSKTASNVMACITAVKKHEPDSQIVVIDDGIEISHRMELMTPACFIPGAKPFVYARNINIGIRATGTKIDVTKHNSVNFEEVVGGCSDVVLLNDDALLQTHGGFSLLEKAAAEHPEYGLISATTNLAGNPQQKPQGVGLRTADRVVAFVCVYIPRRTIETVGLLDERFTAYGWEDNDYCRRVREAGLKLGVHDGCFVDHGSLKSTFRGNPRAAGDIRAGAEIYRAKWGDLN